jgi:hypothetical protein
VPFCVAAWGALSNSRNEQSPTAGGYPLARERNLILAPLIVLAALAWLVLVRQAGGAWTTRPSPG